MAPFWHKWADRRVLAEVEAMLKEVKVRMGMSPELPLAAKQQKKVSKLERANKAALDIMTRMIQQTSLVGASPFVRKTVAKGILRENVYANEIYLDKSISAAAETLKLWTWRDKSKAGCPVYYSTKKPPKRLNVVQPMQLGAK